MHSKLNCFSNRIDLSIDITSNIYGYYFNIQLHTMTITLYIKFYETLAQIIYPHKYSKIVYSTKISKKKNTATVSTQSYLIEGE